MGCHKVIGTSNMFKLAKDPTWVNFKLRRSACSDDLFTMSYCNMVHDILVLREEDEVRDWVNDNRDWMTKAHLARIIGVTPSYFSRWMHGDFSLGYEKVFKCVNYVRLNNPKASNIYIPVPKDVGDFLYRMNSDGFKFATPEYLEWKFRVVEGKCTGFYLHELSNLQFMVSYKNAKTWQNSVFEDYYSYFRMVRDGYESMVFSDF